MAEKEVVNVIKLQIEAGKATPAPPVGPALGSSGVNIMQFVKEFNDRTANQPGMTIPVVISVYKDILVICMCLLYFVSAFYLFVLQNHYLVI